MKSLLIPCAVVWVPIFLYQISRHGFDILLLWLFIGPVASNLINKPGANPFFEPPGQGSDWVVTISGYEIQKDAYLAGASTITLYELFEPTRAILGMFLVVFVLQVLTKRRHVYPLDKTEIWMAIFSILLLASAILQSNRLTFGLRTGIDAFIVPFLAYFFARRFVTNEDQFRNLIKVIGYMAVYVIIIGLIERLMHPESLYRLQGPFYQRDALYITMAVAFFMVLLDSDAFGSSNREKKHALPQGIRWFVISLAPVIIALTLTRGDWLGFLVGLCVFLFFCRRLIKASRALRTVGAAMVLIPTLLIALYGIVPKEVLEQRVQDSGNVHGRYATWLATVNEATKRPIFGIGLNNLRDSLVKLESEFGNAANYSTVHNSFLSLFVELGTIGLLAYLAMVASIIRIGIKLYRTGQNTRDRCQGAAVIAIMLAYLIPTMFANILYVDVCLMHVYVFVVVGAISGLYRPRNQSPATYYSSEECRRPLTRGHLRRKVRSRPESEEYWSRT